MTDAKTPKGGETSKGALVGGANDAAPVDAALVDAAPVDAALVDAARAVRAHAHAPYSRYHVGAAVRGASGKIYSGANVENASYGLALCAERSAVAAAISAGEKRIGAVAVVTSTSPPAAPCGMCRQVLAEFAGDDLPIALVNDAGERSDTTLGALLPHAFRSGDLT